LIVLIFSILQNIGLSMRGIQNAARQRSIVALHMGMDSWLKTGLAVGVMFWLGSSSTAVIIGYTVSATLITASQFFFLRNFLRTKKDAHQENRSKDWRGQIWSFSKPFSIWGLFVWFQQVSDKWALGLFSTTGDIGQYAVLFQLGYVPIGIFTGMMISFLGPILYQRSGAATDDKRNKSVHKLVWYISGVGFLITGVAFIFTLTMNEWLFKFLVAEEFRISSPLLPWVVLAGGIFSVGQILALKLMSDMKVNLIKNVKIITAISGGVMNFYGAWYFGISGVVMALLAFSTFYFLWMAFIVYRASNFDIKIVDKL